MHPESPIKAKQPQADVLRYYKRLVRDAPFKCKMFHVYGHLDDLLAWDELTLEEQINGVENMQYIKSTASNDGSFSISVIFKQGIDPDQAAVNVQNRVQQATPKLPQEVIRMGLTTSKQQNSMIVIFNLYTDDNNKYDELFLQNYANINLVPQMKRVPGVGQVQIFGQKDY